MSYRARWRDRALSSKETSKSAQTQPVIVPVLRSALVCDRHSKDQAQNGADCYGTADVGWNGTWSKGRVNSDGSPWTAGAIHILRFGMERKSVLFLILLLLVGK